MPPLVLVAVNVCTVFSQLGFIPVVNAILIVGVTRALRVTVMLFEVAVVVLAQLAFDVNTQVTIALSANVELVNVALFVPVFAPFTFHW